MDFLEVSITHLRLGLTSSDVGSFQAEFIYQLLTGASIYGSRPLEDTGDAPPVEPN